MSGNGPIEPRADQRVAAKELRQMYLALLSRNVGEGLFA